MGRFVEVRSNSLIVDFPEPLNEVLIAIDQWIAERLQPFLDADIVKCSIRWNGAIIRLVVDVINMLFWDRVVEAAKMEEGSELLPVASVVRA